MTDTQHTDQDTINALAAQQQADQITAELQAAIDALDTNLAALHQETDADTRLAIARNTREWIVYLSGLTENSVALTGSAIAIAKEAMQKYEQAVEELGELTEDIRYANTNNWLVQNLVEEVEQEAYEFASDSVHEQLFDDIGGTLGVDWQQAQHFLEVLRGDYYPYDGIPTEAEVIDALIAALEARKARLDD